MARTKKSMWFDGQAREFDESSGLPPDVGRRVAEAIVELSGAAGDDLILDIGAGTGAIGSHFANAPQRYIGLERSPDMLAMFRRKVDPLPPNMSLAEADCDQAWPVEAQSVTAVFASRVVHHLNIRHFVEETRRVCRTGGSLLLGRVMRDPESLPSRLQRYKRSLLAVGGGERAIREVLDICATLGATPMPPATVARWSRSTTPRQLLDAWEAKPRLTSSAEGNGMSAEQRAAAVTALRDWSQAELGDLDQVHEFTQDYVLQGVTWNRIS